MYSFHHKVATSDVGADGLLRSGVIGLLMQDCSSFQFQGEPVFFNFLQENNLGVFLVSRQVEIYHLPAYGEDIEIWTGIHGCKGFYGLRNTTIRDASGNLCALSFAVGAFVNRDTGKPFVLPRSAYESIIDCEPLPMEYLSRKITLPDGLAFVPLRRDRVVPGYVDANCHLNAGRSLDLAVSCIDFSLSRMRVEYKAQAKPGADLLLESASLSQPRFHETPFPARRSYCFLNLRILRFGIGVFFNTRAVGPRARHEDEERASPHGGGTSHTLQEAHGDSSPDLPRKA